MSTTFVLAAIDDIVRDLAESTSLEEEREGWNDALKRRWRDWFLDLKSALESGRPTPNGGILRAMDFDGIDAKQSSRLTRQAGRISALLD
jgi:hypothetical protein